MKKFNKDFSSPSLLFCRQQKSAPSTPENRYSPRFFSPNQSCGKSRMNEIVLYESDVSFNFQSLPYQIQKRFAQLIPTPTADTFFKTNKTAASFKNFRTIVKDLEIFYYFDRCSYTPNIDNVKSVEVLEKLELKSVPQKSGLEIILLSLPIYFSKLVITKTSIEFNVLKTLIEHQHLNDVLFDGVIDLSETEIPTKVFNAFFDRLTKIRKIRLSISFFKGNEKNEIKFLSSAKKHENSLKIVNASKTVIFTLKIHRRNIYDL